MVHQLISDQLTVGINAFGAELCSVKNNDGIEFIWQADPQIWARHAPVLFPIVGKLKNNKYRLQQNEYQMGQHGFARDMVFELINHQSQQCTFRLNANEESKKIYPFIFTLDITYILSGHNLEVKYTVANQDTKNMYFSIGAHPAFNVPLMPNERFNDYSLVFQHNTCEKTLLQGGLLSENKETFVVENGILPLKKSLFEADALIFENGQIEEILLISAKNAHKIGLKCKNWPYFGVWSKKDCESFVCLEPWYGIADTHQTSGELTLKKGILNLAPTEVFTCSYQLSFQ